MSIAEFIRESVLKPRLKHAGCLVVYDADKRYREQCFHLAADKVRVVDASESSIESREAALLALREVGQPPKNGKGAPLEGVLIYVPAKRPETDEQKQADPFALYAECGAVFPQDDGDEYLSLCLRARPLLLLLFIATVGVTVWLFRDIPKGFFPEEDIGQLSIRTEARQDVSFPAMQALQQQVEAVLEGSPYVAHVASVVGGGGASTTLNNGRFFVELKPKAERANLKKGEPGKAAKERAAKREAREAAEAFVEMARAMGKSGESPVQGLMAVLLFELILRY